MLTAKPLTHWEFSGWYGGGCYPAVIVDPNIKGRLYLLSDVAGLWRSDNGGDKWYFVNEGIVNLKTAFLAISPSDSKTLYLGTKVGIMKSTDAGKTWHYLESTKEKFVFERPHNYRCITVDPQDPNKVYAGTKFGTVFYSGDGGRSWSHLGRGCKDFGGVQRSWKCRYERTEGCPVRGWEGLFCDKYPFKKKVAITSLYLTHDGSKLFAASELGLMQYDFQKKRWIKIKVRHKKIEDMVSVGQEETIWITAGRKIAYSIDYGKSWRYTKAIPKGEIVRLAVAKTGSGDIRLAAGWKEGWEGGVFLSLDNGKTWKDVERNLKHDKENNPTRAWTTGLGWANSINFDKFDSERFYFSDWWGVWRSDDNGNSWNEKIYGAANTVVSDIHITSEGEIYVATMDNGLLKSTDGGKRYVSLFPKKGYNKSINGHVWRVATHLQDKKNVIATSSPWNEDVNQVIISKDGGEKFIIARDGLPARRPRINTMWGKGYPRAIAVDSRNPWIVYLGIDGDDGGGLFVSHDAGWHWKYSDGQPRSKRIYNALVVDPTNSDRIFWGAYGKGGGVYVSEDGGKSWRYVCKKITKVFDLAINPEGWIYAVGSLDGAVIFISKDHGKNWTLLEKFPDQGSAEALFIHPDDPKQIFVGTVRWHGGGEGRIYWSKDGGESWKDITGDLPCRSGVGAMAYDSKSKYLYIGLYAGSVYKTKLHKGF